MSFYVLPNTCLLITDNSGCLGGQKAVVTPFITDRSGRFLSYNFDNLESGVKLYVSIRWRREILRLILECHDIVPDMATAEWTDHTNVTNAEHLHDENEAQYQGSVRGYRFSFVAVSLNDGLVSGCLKGILKFLNGVGTISTLYIITCPMRKKQTFGDNSRPELTALLTENYLFL